MSPAISVTVKTIDDNTPSWPEMKIPENTTLGVVTGCSILENGTVNGNAAIALKIDLGNDTFVLAQLTQGQFEFLAGALRSAVDRFNDLKANRS